MSGRVFLKLSLALALAAGLPVASQGQSTLPAPTIHWEVDPSGLTSAVSVRGLPAATLKSLQVSSRSPDQWAELLSIQVESKGTQPNDRPAMLGSYRVVDDSLRFTPRFAFDRGRTYRAIFRPSRIVGGSGAEVVSLQRISKPERPPTVVTRVTPSRDRVPENLLKFYLYFSSPMSRGEVYNRVRLLKADGQAVDLPFLRLGEELWDPSGTRLTLLIDPGRIKQGLKPREEHGPVLEAGRTYTLVIDPAWLDAEGDPLGAEVRKTFRAEVADEVQPDPKTWSIARPRALSRQPLVIQFPEPLDRALIDSALTLLDPQGREVAGQLEIGEDETHWRFTPESPWLEGNYSLQINTELEDLAGNSIRRPFEVDVQRDTPRRPEARSILLPIPIAAGSP